MGADFIKYAITDRIVVPTKHQHLITEKLILMPGSYYTVDHRYRMGNIAKMNPAMRSTREKLKLPNDSFIFFALNQYYKINKETLRLWFRILRRVPNSVIAFLGTQDRD